MEEEIYNKKQAKRKANVNIANYEK